MTFRSRNLLLTFFIYNQDRLKRFIKNSFLFLSLPITGLILMFLADYDKSFAWNFIEGDCGGHGAWVHDRIYENPKPIDIAFIGSSHIISALDDEQIEIAFQEKGHNLHFANLGYCRLGRNMSFVLVKALLEEKKTKYLVVEIRNDEDRYSHPMFPYVADTEDIWNPVLLFNRDVLTDMYYAGIARKEYWKQKLFYKKPKVEPDLQAYGHASSAAVVQADILEQKRASRIKKASQEESRASRDFYMKYPRAYLEKMAQLCDSKGVKLLFLYTPSFGYIDIPPKELQTYQKYGKVLIPPTAIFNNTDYWADDVHLNEAGGQACSEWFTQRFESIIREE